MADYSGYTVLGKQASAAACREACLQANASAAAVRGAGAGAGVAVGSGGDTGSGTGTGSTGSCCQYRSSTAGPAAAHGDCLLLPGVQSVASAQPDKLAAVCTGAPAPGPPPVSTASCTAEFVLLPGAY